jgi:hypothetical protein
MKESVVLDNDGVCYPDPLINYNNGKLSRIPTLYTITDQDIRKFWVCMWEQYGMNYYDDLWLNANGIPFLTYLKPGDQIYKVSPQDLDGYIKNKILGTE